MKIVSLVVLSSLACQSAAFNLPRAQPSPSAVSSLNAAKNPPTEEGATRRNFIQSAGAVVAASLLTSPTATNALEIGGKIVYGDESIMTPKGHGTSEMPVQEELLYGVSNKLADKISNFNRHFAEMGGYFQSTSFEDIVLDAKGPVTFYDSVTGKPLFVAPIGRSADDFVTESEVHGWPSFRDDEVVWENVRVLKGSGETVSADGTHLGHNLPDRKGNRYCINLVSVAGKPIASS